MVAASNKQTLKTMNGLFLGLNNAEDMQIFHDKPIGFDGPYQSKWPAQQKATKTMFSNLLCGA